MPWPVRMSEREERPARAETPVPAEAAAPSAAERLRGLQRTAGNQAVTRMLLQRTISVGGSEWGDRVYDDVDEARADMPLVYGLDPDVADAHLEKMMRANVRFESEDAWRARIEADLTLPQDRRASALSTATRTAGPPAGLAFTWTGPRNAYTIVPAQGAAPPKSFWLHFEWKNDTGYAELAGVQETATDVDFRVSAPLRYWPEATNQRLAHTNRVIGPAIAEVISLFRARTAANAPNLPAAPAVFTAAAAGGAPNALDRGLVRWFAGAVERRWALEQESENARNSLGDPAAPQRLMKATQAAEAENANIAAVVDKLELDGDPAALAAFRSIAAEVGAPLDKIEFMLGLLQARFERETVAQAFSRHAAAVTAEGLAPVADFAENVVLDRDVMRHVFFAAPRSDGAFIENGINGGHVLTHLQGFLASHPEYDVLLEDEGAVFSVYRQFKWMPARRPLEERQRNVPEDTQREESRPSEAGGRQHHSGWVEAQYPKTVADDEDEYLLDAERTFRRWHTANVAAVTALAPGARMPVGLTANEDGGVAYEGHLERGADGTLRLTTYYPVIG